MTRHIGLNDHKIPYGNAVKGYLLLLSDYFAQGDDTTATIPASHASSEITVALVTRRVVDRILLRSIGGAIQTKGSGALPDP